MKSSFKLFLVVTLLGLAGFIACSPSKTPSPIVGNWKVISQIADTNCTGNPTDSVVTDSAWSHTIYAFNNDGTFTRTFYNKVLTGTYLFVDGNKYLRFSDTAGINSMQVVSFSATTMLLMDTALSRCQVVLSVFKKQ